MTIAAPLNFALIGAGTIGRLHARHLAQHPRAVLETVLDIDAAAAEALARDHGARVATGLDDALSEVDAVLIATSPRTHGALVLAAVDAGKAVFCEKPIDVDLGCAADCVAAVERSGLPFQIGFQRRFDTEYAGVHRAVETGAVGGVELVLITSRDPEPPSAEYLRDAPGCIWNDMMIHDFDLARWFLGEEPVEVFAVGAALADPEFARIGEFDTAAVTLRTARGAMCQINNSMRAVYGYDQRIEVFGSGGMAAAGNVAPSRTEIWSADGIRRPNPLGHFLERYADAYRRELDSFVGDVLDDRQPAVGARHGYRALALAEAARESQAAGRPVAVDGTLVAGA